LAFARFMIPVIIQLISYPYHHGLTKDPQFARLLVTSTYCMKMTGPKKKSVWLGMNGCASIATKLVGDSI
jgi:hypothetical protein